MRPYWKFQKKSIKRTNGISCRWCQSYVYYFRKLKFLFIIYIVITLSDIKTKEISVEGNVYSSILWDWVAWLCHFWQNIHILCQKIDLPTNNHITEPCLVKMDNNCPSSHRLSNIWANLEFPQRTLNLCSKRVFLADDQISVLQFSFIPKVLLT